MIEASIADTIKDLEQEIIDKQKVLQWLHAHPLPDGVKLTAQRHSIDIDRPADRDLVAAIMKALAAGRWERSTNVNGQSVDYWALVDGIGIRLWQAPPPPSCHLEYDEVAIPAQPARIEKRARLVCQDEAPA
jgi:hypothetical protein